MNGSFGALSVGHDDHLRDAIQKDMPLTGRYCVMVAG